MKNYFQKFEQEDYKINVFFPFSKMFSNSNILISLSNFCVLITPIKIYNYGFDNSTMLYIKLSTLILLFIKYKMYLFS